VVVELPTVGVDGTAERLPSSTIAANRVPHSSAASEGRRIVVSSPPRPF
jgi:hypothetical protein